MKWISIKDRLPKSNQLVVLAHKRSDVGIDIVCSNGTYARKWCQRGFYTHWLPLPPHPNKQQRLNYDISTHERARNKTNLEILEDKYEEGLKDE